MLSSREEELMDPEFGDDLLSGFSGPSDQESSAESEAEDHSLDLLSAMLESSTSDKHKSKKVIQRDSCVSQAPTKDSDGVSQAPTKGSDGVKVSELKAKMEAMEAELNLLRQQITSQSLPESQSFTPSKTSGVPPSKTSGVPSSKNSSTRTVSGERVRVAHQAAPGDCPSAKHASSRLPINREVSSKIISQQVSDKVEGVLTEKYSGLRIRNPLISSELMSQRMAARKMVRIPRLPSRVKGGDIEGDWVTIGVVVDKLPPKESKKGDKYSVWKLSDLSGQTAVVTVFLFGQAYQEHWKTPLGHVVALLNPNVLPSREAGGPGQSGVALSLDHPKRLMMMGVSQDFTVCKANTKNGRKCTNFANASEGGYCDYHTQHAYSRSRAHRMECQNGYGPSSGSLQKKLFKNSKTDMFFAGGRTFVASGGKPSKVMKSEGDRLFVPGARQSATHTVQELREQRAGLPSGRGVTTQEGSEIFKQMLQKQSVGARVLTKHIQKVETNRKEAEGEKPVEKSALQLLRDEHKSRTGLLPILGRGCGPGGVVNLGSHSQLSLAKRRAVDVVRGSRERRRSNIMKRVEDGQEAGEDGAPPSKKPRLSSDETNRILNAKSSHDWINEEVELDKEEEYFERLEKKENLEEKLQSIRELRVTVVQCRECNYVAEHPGELCKKESHHLSKFKAMKRCFQCKSCHERQFVYTSRAPVDGCRKCGGTSHVQVSLYRERKGPTLPTEQLKLRGDEEKFLNSLS